MMHNKIKNKPQRTAILGCGNGGITLAADLKSRGVGVALWSDKNHCDKFDCIRNTKAIFLSENGSETKIMPDLVSIELAEVIDFADTIYICTPINTHLSIYKQIANIITNQLRVKLLINLSGNFSGLSYFLHTKNKQIFTKLKVFDTPSFPYACRAINNRSMILGRKNNMFIAPLFPHDRHYLNFISGQQRPSQFTEIANSIELGLMASNAVFHPVTVLINARLIEDGKQFLFYKEGVAKQTSLLHDKLDEERVLLARAMGYKVKSGVVYDNEYYCTNFTNTFDFCINSTVHAKILSPLSLNHRYVTEDVPYGLVPLLALAKLYGIKLPNIESVVTIFSTIMRTDYYQRGMNFNGLTKKIINEIS